MGNLLKGNKLLGVGIVLTICFLCSLALGQSQKIKNAVVLPQGADEKEVMGVAVAQGQKMGYELKREGD